MTLQEANEGRIALEKKRILHGVPIDKELTPAQRTHSSTLEREVAVWGVTIVSLAVTDIVISLEDEAVRRGLQEAVNRAKAAVEDAKAVEITAGGRAKAAIKDAEATVTTAEASAEAIRLQAEALAKELDFLQKQGKLDAIVAAAHIQRLRFYQSMEKTGSNVF